MLSGFFLEKDTNLYFFKKVMPPGRNIEDMRNSSTVPKIYT
jgi:hypothetical protein